MPPPIVPVVRTRAQAERLVLDAMTARDDIERAFYRFGLYLRGLSNPKTYALLGYPTFEELLEKRALAARMTAYKLIQIVDAFDRDPAESLGVEKSYAIIRYAAALGRGEQAARVWQRDPMLEVRPGMRARLSTATARDVIEATRNLQRDDVPEAYVRRVQRATRGISQRLEHLGIESARARSVQRGARMVVRVEVDGSDAEELLRTVVLMVEPATVVPTGDD